MQINDGAHTMIPQSIVDSLTDRDFVVVDALLNAMCEQGIINDFDRDFVRFAIWRRDTMIPHNIIYLGEM
jgi:hypothetical protein